MNAHRALWVTAALLVLPAAPAAAAPDLTLSASHSSPTFLRAQAPNTTLYGGTLTLRVTNGGADPTDGSQVTVTETLPSGLGALVNNPGLGAGPTAASGTGWTCTGTTTSRCTRSDVLAPGDSYPPITVTVSVASSAGATVRNAPAVAGGGDAAGASATDDIPVAADACPNGWTSGPLNPERPDGCTLLDLVWAGEPFADDAAFVGRVDEIAAQFPGTSAAAIVASIKAPTTGPDNSCNTRIALTFDDGPSVYRAQTLAHLRAKGVPATFFDVGMRLEANPQLSRFELADGLTLLGHSWDHPNLGSIPASVLAFEVTDTAARFAANGAPYSFSVLRPPFLSVNAATTAALAAMGFTVTPNPISATDWDPSRSAAQIRDGIVNALRPGVAILLHDGPVDSPAGQATVDAVPLIIDAARARGYCFGTVDRAGQVVANRYVSSGQPIPTVTNPVPYLPLAYPGSAPAPAVTVPQPLKLAATHSPAVFVRGETGTLTLIVSNPTDGPTDGSTTTVTQAIPAGLTSTGAAGTGWTCSGTATITCTRTDVLAPGATFPPIAIGVRVASTAGPVLTTAPKVTGRSGNVWVDTSADRISTAAPVPGDVGGSVPATLSLTLGAPATFGAFAPGVAKDYVASTTATVTSSAGDAALTVSDPGHLTNGAFALPQPLRVELAKASWDGPAANEAVAIMFKQRVEATDALRTGAYSRTLVLTLSTTTP
jgi:peptidoglycan/xylan/chitin deacetylase (PgdA/CDA1 family)